MTTPTAPPLKRRTSTSGRPRPAEPARASAGRGAPKVAARQGVPSAVRPDPHPGTGPRVIGWLHIVTPPYRDATPRATSHCDCGRHTTAHGRDDVLDLITAHHEHRTHCPLHTTPETRQAA